METRIRELTIEDHDAVKDVCADLWEGNDYVPKVFPSWIQDENVQVFGIEKESKLVAISAFEIIPETNVGWVEGLRVTPTSQQKGFGTQLVTHIVRIAREKGVAILRYATSSRNKASMRVAEKTGFDLGCQVGYFRLESPFPVHPQPSPNILPLKVTPERLHEMILQNPDLIDTPRIPLAWTFDDKDLEGLRRLGRKTEFKVVVGENGLAEALFFGRIVGTGEQQRGAYTIYATNRTAFTDIIPRIINELETLGVERGSFFLGQRPKEWSKTLGYVDPEFEERRFLLYELHF